MTDYTLLINEVLRILNSTLFKEIDNNIEKVRRGELDLIHLIKWLGLITLGSLALLSVFQCVRSCRGKNTDQNES